MLARLWWKEWRTFWPLWVMLALASAGIQWLLLKFGGTVVQDGMLTPIALGWSAIYACAVGAAAFAGKRETATLSFLDTLPIDRKTVWLGKATFGLLSTAALAFLLVVMAGLATTLERGNEYAMGLVLVGFGAVIIETLCWSLLWSAFLSNPLIAAVLGICSMGLVAGVTTGQVGIIDAAILDRTAHWRLLVALVALVVSRVRFTPASSQSPPGTADHPPDAA